MVLLWLGGGSLLSLAKEALDRSHRLTRLLRRAFLVTALIHILEEGDRGHILLHSTLQQVVSGLLQTSATEHSL